MKNSLRMTCVAFMACLSAAVLSHASTSTFEIKITGDDKNNGDALPSALIKGAEEAYSVNKKGIDELEKGELDSAMAYFSKASSMLPVYVDAENNMGVVHFRKGNVPTAKLIEVLDRAAQQQPVAPALRPSFFFSACDSVVSIRMGVNP